MSTPTQHPPAKPAKQGARAASSAKSAKSASKTTAKAAPKSAKATRVSGIVNRSRAKQTARVSGLRDGKPLFLGWGRNFTRAQKSQYQHLAMWSFIGVIVLAVVATLGFGVFNELVLVPNQTVVSVNGTNISQDTYRKELAFQAQTVWNRLQTEIAQKNSLDLAVQKGDLSANTQDSIATTLLQTDEANYAQATITQASARMLVENQLIIDGAKAFEQQDHVPASTFEPSQKQIDAALATFKKAFPNGETYAQFTSANGLSDSDVRNAIAIQIRRDNMQAYLAKRLVSPTKQIHLRRIETDTAANAAKVRSELLAGKLSAATWTDLAAKNSLDTNSKATGGDMGWVSQGTGDGGIEYWAFNSARKAGDLSPVITDTSGTFDVVQVLDINPSLAVDAATLKSAQGNALDHWLTMQRVIPGIKVGSANSTMLSASRNLPKKPDLNAALPAITPTVGGGLPPGIGG
ncbi:MAG TPA: peptidylprolyl isomerase [Ktedonobacterales bacterium]|nr:peptidylprolyl isomerase [Ktedonobacterales bacterium]